MRYYTAVGSRNTPTEFISPMANLSRRLRELGWVFRSGKADGADAIFQTGAQISLAADLEGKYGEVYKAWESFNTESNSILPFVTESGYTLWPWWDIVIKDKELISKAEDIVSEIHPFWKAEKDAIAAGKPLEKPMSKGAKSLHTRNVFQVLGRDLNSPSEFLVCYAPVDKHGIPKGGTRTAFVLAQQYDIPCFNFATQSKEEIYSSIKGIIDAKEL